MSNPGNIFGGHKANLNNLNTSEEAKQHSREVIDQEFNGGNIDSGDSMEGKNPGNVVGGHRDTINNPRVSQVAKDSASEHLNQM